MFDFLVHLRRKNIHYALIKSEIHIYTPIILRGDKIIQLHFSSNNDRFDEKSHNLPLKRHQNKFIFVS